MLLHEPIRWRLSIEESKFLNITNRRNISSCDNGEHRKLLVGVILTFSYILNKNAAANWSERWP